MEVSRKVSEYSAVTEIRRFLVAAQKEIGKEKGIVAEGRDIGTVVFPTAELKIFMTANMSVRAERRQAELREKGEILTAEDILQNLKKRDFIDSTREDSPLRQAEDAVLLDTSFLSVEEQTEFILERVQEVIATELSMS
jgi:cytidylate kinase